MLDTFIFSVSDVDFSINRKYRLTLWLGSGFGSGDLKEDGVVCLAWIQAMTGIWGRGRSSSTPSLSSLKRTSSILGQSPFSLGEAKVQMVSLVSHRMTISSPSRTTCLVFAHGATLPHESGPRIWALGKEVSTPSFLPSHS